MAALFNQQKADIESIIKENLTYVIYDFYFLGIISEDEAKELSELPSEENNITKVHTLMDIIEKNIMQNSDYFELLQRGLQAYRNKQEERVERRDSHTSLPHTSQESAAVNYDLKGIESSLEQNLIFLVNSFYYEEIISERDVEELHELSNDNEEQYRLRVNTLMEILKMRITQNPLLLEVLQRILQTYNKDIEENDGNKGIQNTSNTATLSSSVHVHLALSPRDSTQFEPASDSTQFRDPAENVTAAIVYNKKVKHKTRIAFASIQFSSHCSKITVGHRGATIRGEGVQLRVPLNAIKKGCTTNISVQGCLNGPFKLPENVELISPIFLIICEPYLDFQHDATLTIHHFANLQSQEECNKVVLLTSPETPTVDEDGLHIWEFHEHECDQQPQCFPKFTHGEVLLKHFSFECFGIRRSRQVGKYTMQLIIVIVTTHISFTCSSSIQLQSMCFLTNKFHAAKLLCPIQCQSLP